jgi:hypothetical protein
MDLSFGEKLLSPVVEDSGPVTLASHKSLPHTPRVAPVVLADRWGWQLAYPGRWHFAERLQRVRLQGDLAVGDR